MSEPDFPESEFVGRVERTQTLMHEQALDALLFTTEAELRYFTGFRTLFWQSPTRPWFLVLPKSGKPIAVIPQIGAHLMGATWIEDIRTFSAPHPMDEGVSLLADTLIGFSRVGLPMGRESSLRMPLQDFEALKSRLSNIEFLDASPLVQQVRQIKSEAEIAAIRDICSIASKSFANAKSLFKEGQTLKEAFRAFKIDLLQNGADDVPYLVGGAGQGGYGDVISPPSGQPLQIGDALMLDTGAVKNGYFCDFDRNFAIGQASDTVKTAHRKLVQAVDAAADIARPGKTCADLFHAMAEVLGQSDGDVGRLGHGLGMQLTETPSITDFDQTILREQMVMTIEPSIGLGDGKMMVHEENIVIRDGAPEFLSARAAPDIQVI
ncbi:MAG: Xaa-Pro peptidase family protein [Roseibium sp.]